MWTTAKGSSRLWATASGVNGGLALASLGLWTKFFLQGRSWRADFTVFYTGWRMVTDGLGRGLYDFELQTATQQQILGGRHLVGGLLPFNYPPHVALLFTPLAYLSLDGAYLVWSGLQLMVLTWLCWMLWRHLRAEGVEGRSRLLVICTAVAVPAVSATLALGAFSTFMLLCLLSFVLTLRRDDDLQAGVWVALMTLKPQVAVIPALVLVAARRWKAVGAATICGLAVFATTTLVLGPRVWVGFVGAVSKTYAAGPSLGVTPSAMRNLRGLLVVLFGDAAIQAVSTISLLAFLFSLLLVVWLWSSNVAKDLDFDLRMSATLLLGILFNLHVNPQDSVMLAGPVLFFWHYLRRTGRGTRPLVLVALICPSLFWVTERALHLPLASQTPTIAMVILGIWIVRACVLNSDGALRADAQRVG